MDTIDDLRRRIADLEAEVRRLRSGLVAPPGAVSTPVGRDELFSAIEKTRLPMILTDPNQTDEPIIFANRAFQQLCGYSSKELVGRNCRFLQGPDTDRAQVAQLREALRDRQDIAIDILNYRRDGTPFVNELYISPVFDADGRLLYNFGSQFDVTGHRRAVADRVAAETRNRQILDASPDFAVVATDPDGIVTEWSRGAELIMGWTAAETVGRNGDFIFTPEDRAAGQVRKEMAVALAEERAIDERWHMKADGSRFWASGELSPLRTENGHHVGFAKILRDRTEQHLAGVRLEELQAQLGQAQEAGGVGLCTVEIATGILTATPGFSRIYGLPHLERRPSEDFEALVISEDRHLVSSDATRRTGEALPEVEYRIRRADTSEVRWIERKGMFQFGHDNRPVRFVGTARDITEQTLIQRERDDEREQLAAIFSQAPSFMALLRGPEHRFERVNPSYTTAVGGRDVVGRTVVDVLPEAAAQGFLGILDEVYRSGRAYSATSAPFAVQASPDSPPIQRYLDFVYQPIRNAAGEVAGIFVEGVDVTDRIEAARRLRETEDRFRALVENVDVGMCIIQLEFDGDGCAVDYRIVDGNAAYERHTGLYGSVGKWVSEIAPGLERHWFDLYGGVALTGEPARFENGAVPLGDRWFDVQAYRVGDPSERQVAILFTDITARKQAEEQRAVLNAELAHRLKNNLALVQSITTQTLRTAPDMATARKALTERIGALAKAHDILVVGQRDAGDLGAIVAGAVSLHDEGGRVRLEGPNVQIGPKAALTLSLIVHELSTNAAKYGALSVEAGHVEVRWSVSAEEVSGRQRLAFEWREVGGPTVSPPARRSFGTRLIEMGLSGAAESSSELEYTRDGVRCRLIASLTELQAADDH